MRRRVDRAIERLRNAKRPGIAVGTISFKEATVLPIPLEAVLAPVMQLDRPRIWRYAAAALAGFVPAALLGYAAGAGLLVWLIEPLMSDAMAAVYADAKAMVLAYGFWAILIAGVTPIPFPPVMLAAGAAGYPLISYMAATLLSRFVRYFGLALLVWAFGDRAMEIIHRYRWVVLTLAVVAALAVAAAAVLR